MPGSVPAGGNRCREETDAVASPGAVDRRPQLRTADGKLRDVVKVFANLIRKKGDAGDDRWV